jgi:hypothetical protein
MANPKTTAGHHSFLQELLEHVVLRDAGERARLRALLTGEETTDGTEGDEGGQQQPGPEGSAGAVAADPASGEGSGAPAEPPADQTQA